MNIEKQILYDLMAQTAVAYWEKVASVPAVDISKPPWKSGFGEIKKLEPFGWFKSMQQNQIKAQKEQAKLGEQQEKEKLRPQRNLQAEMYAYNHGADFRLLYSDPARAAEMILMDWLTPKSHALLPNPSTMTFDPPMPNERKSNPTR